MKYWLTIMLMAGLTGCPEVSPTVSKKPKPLPKLPTCAVLLENGDDGVRWWTAVKDGENYTRCEVFIDGMPEGFHALTTEQCEMGKPVQVKNAMNPLRLNHLLVEDICRGPSVQYMSCDNRNCEPVFVELEKSLRCTTAIKARRSGECDQLWIRK